MTLKFIAIGTILYMLSLIQGLDKPAKSIDPMENINSQWVNTRGSYID